MQTTIRKEKELKIKKWAKLRAECHDFGCDAPALHADLDHLRAERDALRAKSKRLDSLEAEVERLRRDLEIAEPAKSAAIKRLVDRAERAEAALAAEKKLSAAISRDCNATALERNKLHGALATAHELLREWRATELDTMDEEFQPWIDQFEERIDRALAQKE